MLSFDCYTGKRALQNTQSDCHQWLSHSFRVHQIRLPDLADLRGPTSKGKGRERKGGKGREGEGRKREGG